MRKLSGPPGHVHSIRTRFDTLLLTLIFSCSVAAAVQAEPIRVTNGYIQVGATVTDFLIGTTSGAIGGEQEGVAVPPIISGFSGDVVSLSSSYIGDLGHFTIGGSDLPGRATFQFTAGNVTLPSVDDVLAQPNFFSVFSPFTFTGHVETFASLQDRDFGGTPVASYDLFGRGTTEAQIHVQMTGGGAPLPALPLVAFTTINRFEELSQTPEPASMLLVGSGIAAVFARRRRV
jgi:hypothetical protein